MARHTRYEYSLLSPNQFHIHNLQLAYIACVMRRKLTIYILHPAEMFVLNSNN